MLCEDGKDGDAVPHCLIFSGSGAFSTIPFVKHEVKTFNTVVEKLCS